jgi:hypothetical protein
MPLPVQITSVVIPDILTRENSGSRNAETTHITTKYESPASSPHRNLLHIALFANIKPAKTDDMQYINIMLMVTKPSLIEALYNNKAIIRSKMALTI